MKQNDFYEVNGCTEFIPVTINETYAGGVDVTVNSITHTFRMAVKQVYQFPKQHEPQKVVVPKFVAEWYERNKDDLNTAIYSTITKTYRKVNGENDDLLDVFEGWLVYEDNSILILVQMQFFGFEIEQEQLYTVEIPNNGGFLVLAYINHAMKLVDGNKHLPGKFTKESIEFAGFGWVFDCNGVKVVEVE